MNLRGLICQPVSRSFAVPQRREITGTPPNRPRFKRMDIEQTLARSFDIALKQFVTSEGAEADTIDNRGRLAARLVVLSKLGEQDEQQLASNAVLYLRAFASAMRIASGNGHQARVRGHVALGPDAIAAISEALEQCLNDLPEGGVSSTARDVLQKALLEAAGRGERDASKLTAFALEKLRHRT